MSIPLFPSLRPNIIPFWCDLDPPVDEEAEIQELEREQREWKESLGQVFTNALPIGKTSNNVDEEDLDDMGDDEDGTTSSDADDMDDDDDVPGMFRIHDNLSPPPDVIASNHEPTVPASGSLDAGPIVATTDSPLSPDPEIAIVATTDSPLSPDPEISIVANTDSPLSPDPGIAAGDPFSDSLSSESLSNVTVMNTDTFCVDSGDLQLSSSRLSSRPTRTIVGRHISAPRPGVPQQPVRVAYINTAGRPVYSGRVDSGSVSPTSRFYIDAALQSPTGQIQLEVQDDNAEDDNNDEDRDESEGNSSDALSSQVSQIRPGIRSFPGPMSNLVSQYHQMVAAGHILPSVSSTQINNLIESVHQAQRVHAARATDSGEELVNALSEASPSNVGSVSSTSSDSVATRDEPANEVL